jgi:hypothetical protein
VSQTEFGKMKATPLKPEGGNINVTNSNREGKHVEYFMFGKTSEKVKKMCIVKLHFLTSTLKL